MDRIDAVAIVGISLLALSTTALEPLLVGAAFGGFLLSLSVWRLYGGRPWEALGWLAWVVAAVTVLLDLGGMATLVAIVVFGGLGVMALLGGRFGILADVWSVD